MNGAAGRWLGRLEQVLGKARRGEARQRHADRLFFPWLGAVGPGRGVQVPVRSRQEAGRQEVSRR